MNTSVGMSKTSTASFRGMAKAWAHLQNEAKIGVIRNDAEFKRMTSLVDRLVDEVGSDEKHELAGLLNLLGTLIEQYEADAIHVDDAEPAEVLRMLMSEHNLKQADLASEIGSQGIVSEVLRGKRMINARQAKALAARFHVSASAFTARGA